MQGPADLIPGEAERGSVHETGHIVVALSLGVRVEKISRIEGAELPDVLRLRGFDSSVAVDFSKEIHALEPRRQFLIAFGGMAGETLKFGFYNETSAAHDFEILKPNVFNDAEIRGLIDIAQLMIVPNLAVFNFVSKRLAEWLNNPSAAPLLGDEFNQRFLAQGTRVEVSEHLDRVLPL
jgi:hypothetical protein